MIIINKVWLLYNDTTGLPIVPGDCISEEGLLDYIEKHPFLETRLYGLEELKKDLTITEGIITFHGLVEIQMDWIEKC